MRIDPRFIANAAGATAQASRPAQAARFSLDVATKREATRANSSAPLATLDAILMLQQEEDPAERRRRHARRGSDLLDGLGRLKAALLTGAVPVADLESLSRQIAAGSGATGDPGLDEAVAAIELRVKVELAKLGRA